MKDFKHQETDGIYWLSKASDSDYYDIELYIDEMSSRREMNKYYNLVKDRLQEKGFRLGNTPRSLIESKNAGTHGFYIPVFVDYANNLLLNSAPEMIIFTDDYQYRQMVNGEYIVSFKAWTEPKVKFNDKSGYQEPDEAEYFLNTFINNIKIKVPEYKVSSLVNDRLENFKRLHPNLMNKVDSDLNQLPSDEGDMLEVTIESFIDGRKFKEGSETSNVRLFPQAVAIKPLYDRLIGVKERDNFILEIDTFGELVNHGKLLKLDVTVNHVYKCVETSVDDDLATTAGFGNLEKWKEYLTSSISKVAEKNDIEYKRNRLLSELMTIFDVGNISSGWIEQKIMDIVAQSKHRSIRADIVRQLVDTRRQLSVLNFVGKILNIEYEDEEKTKSASNKNELLYVNTVMSALMKKVTFEYVDFTELENRDGRAMPAS